MGEHVPFQQVTHARSAKKGVACQISNGVVKVAKKGSGQTEGELSRKQALLVTSSGRNFVLSEVNFDSLKQVYIPDEYIGWRVPISSFVQSTYKELVIILSPDAFYQLNAGLRMGNRQVEALTTSVAVKSKHKLLMEWAERPLQSPEEKNEIEAKNKLLTTIDSSSSSIPQKQKAVTEFFYGQVFEERAEWLIESLEKHLSEVGIAGYLIDLVFTLSCGEEPRLILDQNKASLKGEKSDFVSLLEEGKEVAQEMASKNFSIQDKKHSLFELANMNPKGIEATIKELGRERNALILSVVGRIVAVASAIFVTAAYFLTLLCFDKEASLCSGGFLLFSMIALGLRLHELVGDLDLYSSIGNVVKIPFSTS